MSRFVPVGQVVKRALATHVGWRVTAPVRKAGCLVLTYHRVGPPRDPFPNMDVSLFERQMAWIHAHCRPIAPDLLQHAACNPDRLRPQVLVTFDDAYPDFYEHAYPILKRLEIPAVCFVPTDHVDRRLPFWWDVLHTAVGVTGASRVTLPWPGGAGFTLEGPGKPALLRACKTHIKGLPDDQKDPTVRRLLDVLGVEGSALHVPPSTMTWEQIRATMDVTTFGGHTHTHAIMPVLPPERLRWEVETCRDRLQVETGVRPRLFAYPSGAFNEPVKAAVRSGGFDLGFSTLEGVNGPGTDWFEIRRIHAPASVEDLAWLLSGVPLDMATRKGSGPELQ